MKKQMRTALIDILGDDRRLVGVGVGVVVFISERSEVELIGNDHAGTALQNECGPEQMSGGDAKSGADEERRCHRRDRSGKLSLVYKGLERSRVGLQECTMCTGKFKGTLGS